MYQKQHISFDLSELAISSLIPDSSAPSKMDGLNASNRPPDYTGLPSYDEENDTRNSQPSPAVRLLTSTSTTFFEEDSSSLPENTTYVAPPRAPSPHVYQTPENVAASLDAGTLSLPGQPCSSTPVAPLQPPPRV